MLIFWVLAKDGFCYHLRVRKNLKRCTGALSNPFSRIALYIYIYTVLYEDNKTLLTQRHRFIDFGTSKNISLIFPRQSFRKTLIIQPGKPFLPSNPTQPEEIVRARKNKETITQKRSDRTSMRLVFRRRYLKGCK